MKLLIDISKHIYEHAKEMTEDSIDEGKAMRAIANGSPLPKEHGDLIAEKERLIKKDMGSIENRVRHAFNQGYEMGLKEGCSEIPNTCEDAVSRQAAIRAIEALQLPIMREASTCYQFKFSGMSEAKEAVENLPSVTPQQRMGRWEYRNIANSTIVGYWCDNCHIGSSRTYNYCPNCGCKMEVDNG